MKRFSKILTAILALALTAALSVGLTLAYLTDEDEAVNVMTLGNVQIAQHEYERVVDENGNYEMVTVTTQSGTTKETYKVQEFAQAKPLYPSVGKITGYDTTSVRWEQLGDPARVMGGHKPLAGINNVQDKFVLVENTGKTDAYVRTIIAFELGSKSAEEWDKEIIGINHGSEAWLVNEIGTVTIDENNYFIYEYIYNAYETRHAGGVLPAGDWTYNSLAQVYLMSGVTNEDCIALDGNKNGTYDILVVSQAVQTEGFANAEAALDTAFGDITIANHPWADNAPAIPSVASNEAELKEALKAGGNVYLADDITITSGIVPASGAVLDLNGYTLTDASTGGRALGIQKGAEFTIEGDGVIRKDPNVESAYAMPFYVSNGTLTVNSGIYNMGTPAEKDYNSLIQNSSKVVINGGTFTNDCPCPLFYVIYSSTLEINGGFFESVGTENPDLLDLEYHYSRISTITIKGGTFVNYNPLEDDEGQKLEIDSDGAQEARVIVPDGYKVVSETQTNGDVWYTVIAE